MDKLPTELVTHLCLLLEKPSLCSLRLTCKALALIAEEHLFSNFEFRLYPNHHRLYQFEQLAAHPSIASRLGCVTFETGVLLEYADFRYWKTQVCIEKRKAWERSRANDDISRLASTEFHESLEARFTPDLARRYDLYRWHLDQQAGSMAEWRVRDVLMRPLAMLTQSCPKLKFKLIMTEPQIELEELEAFDAGAYTTDKPYDHDPRRRVTNRRHHCLDHFLIFLNAATLSGCELADLTAIEIPYQLLTVDVFHGALVLEMVFGRLKGLDMKLSSFPPSDWLSRMGVTEVYSAGRNQAARRLRVLLNHCSALEDLSLEFPLGTRSEFSFELFDRTNIDRFPRSWVPHLKSLTLRQFRCSWEDLEAFLSEGRNVQFLTLENCRLETGSMIDMLEYLAERRLPHTSVLGAWDIDEDMGEWHSHSEEDFRDCFAEASHDGLPVSYMPYVDMGLRSKVEDFIHGKSTCPLPRRNGQSIVQALWELMGDTSWHFISGRRQA